MIDYNQNTTIYFINNCNYEYQYKIICNIKGYRTRYHPGYLLLSPPKTKKVHVSCWEEKWLTINVDGHFHFQTKGDNLK